eukprot:s176_g29.t2
MFWFLPLLPSGGHGRAMGKRDADSDEDDGGKKPRLSGLGAFGGLGFSNSAPPPDHGSPEMQFDQLLGASFLPAVPGGNLGPIADIDPLKPATTPMDFSRLGTSLPSQDFPVPRDMVEYLMTPEHRQIILEETGCDVDWAPDEAKALLEDLLFFTLAQGQHQTPDDLTKEVQEAQEEVCQQWRSNRLSWSHSWRSSTYDLRRAQILESVPSIPKAPGTGNTRRALTGEDVEGFADLCPEFNLEDMSSDPHVLLELLDTRCNGEMKAQRSIQDADLALARQLARSGKIGKRSSGSRKLFYLRDAWCMLGDHFLDKERSNDVEDDINESTIPGDMAFWCCGLLVAVLFWTCVRLTRRILGESQADGPPPDLCCPMSLELFTDPVVAADGETYERWWIEKWIHDKTAALECRPRHGTGVLSPMGHGMLKHAKLVSNQAVRRLANQWREKHEKSM